MNPEEMKALLRACSILGHSIVDEPKARTRKNMNTVTLQILERFERELGKTTHGRVDYRTKEHLRSHKKHVTRRAVLQKRLEKAQEELRRYNEEYEREMAMYSRFASVIEFLKVLAETHT